MTYNWRLAIGNNAWIWWHWKDTKYITEHGYWWVWDCQGSVYQHSWHWVNGLQGGMVQGGILIGEN